MQVGHSMYAYYEERVYGSKRAYVIESDAELDAHFSHLTFGPIRVGRLFLFDISLSACELFLRSRLTLVCLAKFCLSMDLVPPTIIAALIDATPRLRQLDLSNINGTLCDLIATITHHKNMTALTVRESSLTADDIKAIAKILQHNAVITDFELSWCAIDDDGGALIAEALSHNTKITRLRIEYSHYFGIQTATALRDAIIRPTSPLTALHLWLNIGNEGYADDYAVILE